MSSEAFTSQTRFAHRSLDCRIALQAIRQSCEVLFALPPSLRLSLASLLLSLALLFTACAPRTCGSITALGNLGSAVNSPYDDYAPVLVDTSTLIYSSNRVRVERAGLAESFSEGRPAYLWLSMRLAGEGWDMAQPYELLLSQGEQETATISFPPRPNALDAIAYFGSCDREGGAGECDIYVLTGGDAGGAVDPGPGLNSATWDGHPFVTTDGKRLWFASDREGGNGGLDIWYVDQGTNGLWGEPRHAAKVNTPSDEMSPFVDPASGDLYYATSTDEAGLDIWVLRIGQETPERLPAPYNSSADDFTPFIFDGRLYVASNREGGCGGFDVYGFPY